MCVPLFIIALLVYIKCDSIDPIEDTESNSSFYVSLNHLLNGEGETKTVPGDFYPDHHVHYHYHHYHHHYYHYHYPHHYSPSFNSFNRSFVHPLPEEHVYKHEKPPLLKNKNSTMIPLDLIQKFNNFSEINDALINLVEGHIQDEAPVLEDRFSIGERSAAIVPKSAACMPELETVKIVSNDDPSILYVPSCTRLERCGGCCSHSLLSCQPTDVETVSFQVVKTQFVGGSKLKFMGKEVVLVERHTKCKCDCKVQEKDCHKLQEYRKSECRCACTNVDEEKKCYKENITKLWNPEICACECRNILQCSTGYTFDALRCRCMPVYIRRRYAEMPEYDQEKTRYQTDVLPIVPLVEGENIKDNL